MKRKVTDEAKATAAIQEAEQRIEQLPMGASARYALLFRLGHARHEYGCRNYRQAAQEARALLLDLA